MRQVVMQNPRRTIIRRDQYVDAAVIIDVPEGGAAAHAQLRENRSGIAAFINESPFPSRIADQQVALEEGIRLTALFLAQCNCPVRQKQVEPSIVIEIEPAGSETGVWECDGVDTGS